jgi:hypothetical protein
MILRCYHFMLVVVETLGREEIQGFKGFLFKSGIKFLTLSKIGIKHMHR